MNGIADMRLVLKECRLFLFHKVTTPLLHDRAIFFVKIWYFRISHFTAYLQ